MSTRTRTALVVTMVMSAGLLASCDAGSGGPADADAAGATASPSVGVATTGAGTSPRDDLLWTSGMVRQGSPAEEPALCVGMVLQSYPPQCGGDVRLVGWDWGEVDGETVKGGVTWIDTVHVVGTFADGTFTLARRPSITRPPEAGPEPTPTADDFPELCEDPLRGAAESARAGVSADTRALSDLGRRLEAMAGYVASWVSDGHAFLNVVVTDDPERVHAVARTLWSGRLCVQQRAVATLADMLAAQKALRSLAQQPHQCLSSSPGPDGRLLVGVTLADPETVAAVHRLVSPWLEPDDVVITSRLRPLVG
jgi:hypothetical protein